MQGKDEVCVLFGQSVRLSSWLETYTFACFVCFGAFVGFIC